MILLFHFITGHSSLEKMPNIMSAKLSNSHSVETCYGVCVEMICQEINWLIEEEEKGTDNNHNSIRNNNNNNNNEIDDRTKQIIVKNSVICHFIPN